MNIFTKNNYIDSSSPFALSRFSNLVFKYLSSEAIEKKEIILSLYWYR